MMACMNVCMYVCAEYLRVYYQGFLSFSRRTLLEVNVGVLISSIEYAWPPTMEPPTEFLPSVKVWSTPLLPAARRQPALLYMCSFLKAASADKVDMLPSTTQTHRRKILINFAFLKSYAGSTFSVVIRFL